MPNTREKLTALLYNFHLDTNNYICDRCGDCSAEKSCAEIADHLVANGVTVQEWIPASEPPEEHDSLWVKLYETKSWQPGLFRKCSYDVLACVEKKDGSRRVISIRTFDSKWDHNKLNEETVICWHPMPQPPRRMIMLNLDGEKPDHIPQDQWDRMKESFEAIYEEESE